MAFGSGGKTTNMAERRRKFVVLGVSSLILVSMVVALTVGMNASDKTETSNRDDVSTSIKAVCQSTDYQKTCIDSLSAAAPNTSDPKELVRAAFEVAIKQIEAAANNSTVLQELHKDPRTKAALKNCQELAARAVADLRKSFDKMGEFSIDKIDELLLSLKIWLSAAMTYEETCLDGFEDTQGDAGEKMRQALKTAMELTSNGLAMVTEVSLAFDSLNFSSTRRRLMSTNVTFFGYEYQLPEWFHETTTVRHLFEKKHSKEKPIKANITVAQDGTGNFTTINEALPHIPPNGKHKFIIHIKEGIYRENVHIFSNMTHVILIGDGPTKTRITGSLNFIDGTPTYQTATVAVSGDYFIAKNIGFENSAGPEKHQAVALRVGADKSIFYNCHMDGYQDTLYAHTYRQYYRDCTISGTIDFIFGDSAAIFQNCVMLVRKPMDNQQCIVTAQGRKDMRQPTGIVLQNCTILADPGLYPVRQTLRSYMGRPWKEFSRTIIMESYIDDLIQPQGWLPWNETFALNTLFYSEFNNRGPGAGKLQRVPWSGVKELPASRVERYTAKKFIEGNSWIPYTKVPYVGGFIFPVPKDDPTLGYSEYTPEEDKDASHKKDKSSYKMPDLTPNDNKGSSSHNPKIPESQISQAPAASPVGAPGEPQISAIFLSLFKREEGKQAGSSSGSNHGNGGSRSSDSSHHGPSAPADHSNSNNGPSGGSSSHHAPGQISAPVVPEAPKHHGGSSSQHAPSQISAPVVPEATPAAPSQPVNEISAPVVPETTPAAPSPPVNHIINGTVADSEGKQTTESASDGVSSSQAPPTVDAAKSQISTAPAASPAASQESSLPEPETTSTFRSLFFRGV